MKKVIILIPVYNDWESVQKVLNEINSIISEIKKFQFQCIIVNDCSINKRPKINKPKHLLSLKILNMKKNTGHARCNAVGLRYINLKETFDYVIVMDSDGEDRPVEIKDLINKIFKEPDYSVVAKRVKRSEGIVFQTLYQIHKLITFFFTGKKVNFGNYSCLTKNDVKILSNKASLWSSFSGSVKKHITRLNEINSSRGSRYFGPSKMSLLGLIIHSFSIIAVFKYNVFFRSALIIIILSFFTKSFSLMINTFQIMIVFFNLLILIISTRENKKALFDSHEQLLNENEIIH
tara:strand:- start:1232 stop:2104 length:873 start_codon:yes stop_codon:yes gene_type:complete